MVSEFLIKEYELCYEQLRYYDTRHSEILKYIYTISTASAAAIFAIFKLAAGATTQFHAYQAFLTTIVYIATLLLFATMLQNRLYFVYIARQINAIRGYMLTTDAENFKNNQLYISTDFPALKPSSVHTIQLLGVTLISSVFFGFSVYSVIAAAGADPTIACAVLATLAMLAAEIWGGIKYLSDTKGKSADEAIHNKT